MLIYLIKGLILLKSLLVAFFVYIIFRPLRVILKFIFNKIVVKLYCGYLSFFNKLGLPPLKQSLLSFIFHQKLVHALVATITVILVFTNLSANTRADELIDKTERTILQDLIKSEFSEFEEDEQLVVETFDQEATISEIQQSYLDNLSSVKAQPRVSMDEADDLAAEDRASTIQNGSSIIKPDIASTKVTKRERSKTITYTVQPGDTVSTIAAEFDISVSTILWENDLSAYSIIRPGDDLDILPMSGVAHKVASGENIGYIADKYDVEESKILEANKLAANSTLQINQKLLIPDGRKINYSSYKPTTYSGITAIKEIVKAPGAQPVSGNKMNWPTDGSRITQYYSWRHHGVDIANKNGTPIYAADAGTVEMVGWGTGYGYQVVVDHGGGKKTRYAHLSKYHVEKGQRVDKGETIAAMGSTGWSTGPHLHFEVIINNAKYNPLNYIK